MVLGTACGDDSSDDDGDDGMQMPADGSVPDSSNPNPNPGDGGDTMDGGDVMDAGLEDGSTPNPDGGSGSLIANAQSISWGTQPCGSSTPLAPKTITFTNNGAVPVTWSAALSSTSQFSIAAPGGGDAGAGSLSGSLAVGASQTFTVSASPVSANATAGQSITATLTVTTSLPSPYNAIAVPVSVTPYGANVQLTAPTGPRWGQVSIIAQVPADAIAVTLRNTGNAPANVQIVQPEEPAFQLRTSLDASNNTLATQPFTLTAAGSASGNSVTYGGRFSPSLIQTYNSFAAVQVGAPVCNGGTASISTIPFEGSGTANSLNTFISDDLPQFVGCGTAGQATATITVHNYRISPVTVTAAMLNGAGSDYTVTPSVVVPSGADGLLQIALKDTSSTVAAVPGTNIQGRVLVTTPNENGQGTSTEFFEVMTTVQGAVLSIEAVDPFNNGARDSADRNAVSVRNNGNMAATATLTIVSGDTWYAVTQQPGTVAPGSAAAGSVDFTPEINDTMTRSGTIRVRGAAGDYVCDPQPADVGVAGRAKSPVFELVGDTTSVDFHSVGAQDDEVLCPPGNAPTATLTAAGPEVIQIKNNGVDDMTWTATLGRTDRFSLSGGGATYDAQTGILSGGADLASGQSAAITITPLAITMPAFTDANYYGDTLTIGTNVPSLTVDPINLRQTATGARFDLASTYSAAAGGNGFGIIHRSTISSRSPLFTVTNNGNAESDFQVDYDSGEGADTALGSVYYEIATRQVNITMGPNDFDVGRIAGNASTQTFDGTYHPFRPSTATPAGPGYDPDSDIGTSTLVVALTTTAPLCAALPDDLVFRTTATDANISWNYDDSLPITIPEIMVNTFAADTGSLTLTNAGNQALEIVGFDLEPLVANDDGEGRHFDAFIGTGGVTTAVVAEADSGISNRVSITIVPKRKTPAEFNALTPVGPCTSNLHKTVSEEITLETRVVGEAGTDTVTYTLNVDYVCPP